MGGCASVPEDNHNSTSAALSDLVLPAGITPSNSVTSTSSSKKGHQNGFRLSSSELSPSAGSGPREDTYPVIELPMEGELRVFSFQEVSISTRSFSHRGILGEGGFGKVYKAGFVDASGTFIEAAIKVLSPNASQGIHELVMEIKVLCRLIHPNLVRLYGYCRDKTLSLVYEYIPLKSLDYHLFNKDPETSLLLTWQQRLNIAVGAAKGLAHLHENDVIHRDFKAANILITKEFETKLADFGLAKDSGGQTHVSTAIMGTLGYLDPTYASTGQLTKKSDVYAYGVVLLELLTGKKAMGLNSQGKPLSLATWAKPYIENNRMDVQVILDPRLPQPFPKHIARFIATSAKFCLSLDAKGRPDIQVLVDNLSPLLHWSEENGNA